MLRTAMPPAQTHLGPAAGRAAAVQLASLPRALLETILDRLAILFLTGAGGDLPAARQAAISMLMAHRPGTEDELTVAAEIVSFGFHALEALGQCADPKLSLNQKLRLQGRAISLSRESHKARHRLDQLKKAAPSLTPPVDAMLAGAESADSQPLPPPSVSATGAAVDPAPAPPIADLPAQPLAAQTAPAAALSAGAQSASPQSTTAQLTSPQATSPQPSGTVTGSDACAAPATGSAPAPQATVNHATRQTWTQAFQQHQRAKRIAENLKKNQPATPESAAPAAPAP